MTPQPPQQPPPSASFDDEFTVIKDDIAALTDAPADAQTLENWRALQKRVDELCAALTARPPEAAHTALPDLASLIAEMDRAITVLEGQNPAG